MRRSAVAAVVVLLLISAAGGAIWWSQSFEKIAETPHGLSIAVLPFTDLSEEERGDRLTDAFTDEVITELAHSSLLRVIASNSVFTYKDKPVDVREVGDTLNVTYVLEGSLQILPEEIRVTAQLINAQEGSHIWAKRFNRPVAEFFAVRDGLVAEIVGTLTGWDGPIWEEWRNRARRRPPKSLTALDYALLADEP